MKVYEYRIVKIEKGIFLIEYKTSTYGVWHEVKNKQFKTRGGVCIWSEYNSESCLKREEV